VIYITALLDSLGLKGMHWRIRLPGERLSETEQTAEIQKVQKFSMVTFNARQL
jgi:hypothetical protein